MEESTRERFIWSCKAIAGHWRRTGESVDDAVDGAIFSILVLLDGGNGAMGEFDLSEISGGGLHEDFTKERNNGKI